MSVAFHKSYSEYVQYMNYIKQFPQVKVEEFKSFIIDLSDKGHFLYLSLSMFADYSLRTKNDRSE